MKHLLASLISVLILTSPVGFAQSKASLGFFQSDTSTGAGLSEYVYKLNDNDILVPVRLLGSVRKPGLYHIPVDTSLLTLLSIAGGPTDVAETEDIEVTNSKGESKKVELSNTRGNPNSVKLANGDTVWIPKEATWFSNNTVTAVSVISGIVGIILSTIIISNQ